jgi:hypothetical protein
LAAAAVLYAAATVVAPRNEPPPLDVVTRLLRPLALPFLWRGLEAGAQEPPEAQAARARQLLRLLPAWVDGHVHFAAMLAFDASSRAVGEEVALDRVLAGVAMLEEAVRVNRARVDELWAAIASFIEIRADQDPGIAAAFRRRMGLDAAEAADLYLERAIAAAPAFGSLRERRTYLRIKLVASALRVGDDARAIAILRLMRRELARASAPDLAAAWDRSLAALEEWLAGGKDDIPAGLEDDPHLGEVAAALRERGLPR